MFEAEEVQDGGVEIVNADGLFLGFVAELVGGADDLAAADFGSGHPDGHGTGVVVTAKASLGDGHAAEFAVPDDEGIVEHAAGFEIGEQPGDGGVGGGGVAGVVCADVFVGVPGIEILVAEAAVIELDEADTAFDETAGHEALATEGFGVALVEAVEGFGGGGFTGQVDGFGRGALHAVGEFVAFEAGGEFGVSRGLGGVDRVEFGEGGEAFALFVVREAGGRFEIENGIAGGAEDGALVGGGHEAGGPVGGAAEGAAALVIEDDVAGEVFIHRAEAVGDPGAEGGEAHADLAAGEGIMGLDVVVRFREDAADEGVFVGKGSEFGEEFTDFEAALAVAMELKRRGHQGPGVALADDDVAFAGEGLAGKAGEGGLGVEGVYVADAAAHEQGDDAFGAGGVVGGGFEGGEGERAETAAGFEKKFATGRHS